MSDNPMPSGSRRRGLIFVVPVIVAAFLVVGGFLIFGHRQAAPRTQTIDLRVSARQMSPNPIKATQGDTLKITVTADEAGEVHVHGYDWEFPVEPQKPVTKTVKADRTGTFPIELHYGTGQSQHADLGRLEVTPS